MDQKHDVLSRLVADLEAVGIGSDGPVNGGDLVDVMATYYEAIKQALAVQSNPARVVIHLDGGLIDRVHADCEVEYLVYDYDIEGLGEDEVAVRPGLYGNDEVYKSGWMAADVEPDFVARAFDCVMQED